MLPCTRDVAADAADNTRAGGCLLNGGHSLRVLYAASTDHGGSQGLLGESRAHSMGGVQRTQGAECAAPTAAECTHCEVYAVGFYEAWHGIRSETRTGTSVQSEEV